MGEPLKPQTAWLWSSDAKEYGFVWFRKELKDEQYFLSTGVIRQYGQVLISDLGDLSNCRVSSGECLRSDYTVVWAPPQAEERCHHTLSATVQGIVTTDAVVVESLQRMFLFDRSRGKSKCVPHGYHMKNDVILTIAFPVEETLDKTRSKRSADNDDYHEFVKRANWHRALNKTTDANTWHDWFEAVKRNIEAGCRPTPLPHPGEALHQVLTKLDVSLATDPTSTMLPTTTTTTTQSTVTRNRWSIQSKPLLFELPKRIRRSTDQDQDLDQNKTSDHQNTLGDFANAEVNTRLQYLEHYIAQEARQNFNHLWTQICGVHNRQVGLITALIRMDPTSGARLWLNRDDVTARLAGDALRIAPCLPVEPQKLHTDFKVDGTCFEQLPVTVDGRLLFVRSGTQDLVDQSRTVPCENRVTPIFKNATGWYSPNGKVGVNLGSEFVQYERTEPRKALQLDAPSLFPTVTENMLQSVQLVSSHAERLSQLERFLRIQDRVRFGGNGTIDLAFGNAADLITDVAHGIGNGFTSIKDTIFGFFELTWHKIAASIAGILLIATTLSIACCRLRRKAVKTATKELLPTIFAVQDVPTMPSAPPNEDNGPSESARMLYYVPKTN
uniref:CST complex subunit CTC1 n=1 Tax=Steinernema glaseri TaxID=37863 RepID=A0A1I7ZE35_9BILA